MGCTWSVPRRDGLPMKTGAAARLQFSKVVSGRFEQLFGSDYKRQDAWDLKRPVIC